MSISEKKLERWKEAIPRMNEEDLEFILDFPECFESQIRRLVKARLKRMTQQQDEYFDYYDYYVAEDVENEDEEELEEDTPVSEMIEILEELEIPYSFDEDGDIVIEYEDEKFTVMLMKKGSPFIHIFKNNWLTVNMDDYEAVSRLYHVINELNNGGFISITYTKDEQYREINVHFCTTSLFFSEICNCEDYLKFTLDSFFCARIKLGEDMQKLYDERRRDTTFYFS